MVKKSNQIVIQKVSNGFIMTKQVKGNSGIFGSSQEDKVHLVATSNKEILKLLKTEVPSLLSEEEIELLEEKEQKALEVEEDE